jgi:diaminopimelate epimerase
MKLEKYSALGNDFLVLLDLDSRRRVDGELARALCDRRHGVGADGLIHAKGGSSPAVCSMVLYNADGGRAEMSGNGIRCLALALVAAGVDPASPIAIDTDAGLRWVRVLGDGTAQVDMGPARTRPAQPCRFGTGRTLAVDLGNPHQVVEVVDPAKVDLDQEAALLGPVNLEVVAAGAEAGELTMRVSERGVGETFSCGTGACAAAVAAREWGLVGDVVTVHQPGGALEVTTAGDGTLLLTGPATHVATVEVSGPWR